MQFLETKFLDHIHQGKFPCAILFQISDVWVQGHYSSSVDPKWVIESACVSWFPSMIRLEASPGFEREKNVAAVLLALMVINQSFAHFGWSQGLPAYE